MKTQNRWKSILVMAMIIFCITACSGTFTIKEDAFSASSVCDGEGELIFHTVNGEIQV